MCEAVMWWAGLEELDPEEAIELDLSTEAPRGYRVGGER